MRNIEHPLIKFIGAANPIRNTDFGVNYNNPPWSVVSNTNTASPVLHPSINIPGEEYKMDEMGHEQPFNNIIWIVGYIPPKYRNWYRLLCATWVLPKTTFTFRGIKITFSRQRSNSIEIGVAYNAFHACTEFKYFHEGNIVTLPTERNVVMGACRAAAHVAATRRRQFVPDEDLKGLDYPDGTMEFPPGRLIQLDTTFLPDEV